MSRQLAWLLVLAAVASPLHAQHRNTAGFVRAEVRCSPKLTRDPVPCDQPADLPNQTAASASAWAIAASAVLPGSGQAILANNRALPYLAVEAFAWTSYVRHSLEYRRHRDGYRGLASRVARAPFSSIRPNGSFEYYERMTHYLEAGRFDVFAGGGIDPETDSLTFNGAVWLLARRTYWSNPAIAPDTSSSEWQRAVAFYRARAYDQLYRWSWSQAPQEYAAFLALIGESNDANRRAMTDLGVVIANHVLSTVDAYITIRVTRDSRREGFGLEASMPMATFPFGGKDRRR
jgi:hypothetical protein